jgi:hypothetical protein
MGRSLSGIGAGIITTKEVREAQMADERRHERRNARGLYARGDLGLPIRVFRQRFLPTENGHAALLSGTGVTCGYQSDSSSKRPVSSVTLAFCRLEGALSFLRPKPLPRLSGEAKERKQTMKNQVREPCRLTLDAGRSISESHPWGSANPSPSGDREVPCWSERLPKGKPLGLGLQIPSRVDHKISLSLAGG